MIRAVVWKEFREQWIIALTLVVLGGGLLIGVATLTDPPVPGAAPGDVFRSLGIGRMAALALVVTAGTVCGGALFAAEREAGTLTFLEVLPARRWALWRAKVVAGAALALAQACVLLAVAGALGLADRPFAARAVMYAVLAFAWGALGSTVARTTLGSVGIAIPAATLATFAFLLPICIVFAPPGSNLPRPLGWVVFEVLMLAAPLGASGWWFTAPDRARATGHDRPASAARALVWLGLKQLRVTGPVLSAFALAFGFALLAPDVRVVYVWPALALGAGALAGVTAFGDEQAHRTAPFWAEGRLPIGRAWWAKIGLHLLLVGWLLFLLALPSAARAQLEGQSRFGGARDSFAVIFRDRLFDELRPQAWKYLLVPAVYGFAAGHLCGLLFRKLVVACGVAVMVGGGLAVLWWPSLLAGGLRPWQAWLPAAALLLTGRLVLRAWASDRVAGRGPLLRATGGAGAALLVFALGIGYRVLEVPDLPGGEDDVAFVDALPTYDENLTGRDFRSASERYARAAAAATPEPERPGEARRRPRIDDRLELALRQGWPVARGFRVPLWNGFKPELVFRDGWPLSDPEMAAWLDRTFDAQVTPGEPSWHAIAAGAGAGPVGVFEPPQLVTTAAATAASLDHARRMAVALLARALQQQAGGDADTFPLAFRTAVALSQNLRNGSGVAALVAGIEVERLALYAADRWLERYAGPAAPLRALARVLERRDPRGDLDPLPHYLADRYALRELVRAPGPWLSASLTPAGGTEDQAAGEADLVALAWTVPWERERTRRLLGLGFERGTNGPPPHQAALVAGRPGSALFLARNRSVGDLVEADRYLRAHRRAAILKFAVRAYMADTKSAPAGPADLTAGPYPYLDAVPDDPYREGEPFGYRVSAGENLRAPRALGPTRTGEEVPFPVRPGQVLVWSAGIDREDQGGQVAPGGPRSEDLVFLVPMPPAAPK